MRAEEEEEEEEEEWKEYKVEVVGKKSDVEREKNESGVERKRGPFPPIRLLDSSKVQQSLEDGKEGRKDLYSRMFSVVSSTVSVLRRLSANIKAPVSTVSRRRVAECSCPLMGSSLHAAWALGCSRLFTVSTIAWGSSGKKRVNGLIFESDKNVCLRA
ncbi:hypothetical protein EYF80_028573 [Liparis tanakae]|uniref:Uncharacterized protein n=1 Tax=Liparis tanakae TaxID=230148 RepID=A0A4Z2H5N4_9TELE|nr:hypothetical protein EYF80_028573 [Liparis tanakae]